MRSVYSLKVFRINRKSIESKVLKIIFILLAFLCLFSMVNNYYFKQLIDKEFRELRERESDNINKVMMEKDGSLKNLSLQLFSDRKVMLFNASPEKEITGEMMHEVAYITNYLDSIKIAAGDITDIIIYFKKFNLAVGSRGTYSEDVFFKNTLANDGQSIRQWLHSSGESSGVHVMEGSYLLEMWYKGENKSNLYIRNGTDLSIVIVMNKEYSNALLKRMISSEDTVVTILDNDMNIFACNRPELVDSKGKDFLKEALGQKRSQILLGEEAYLVSDRKSSNGAYHYVFMHKKDLLSKKLVYVNMYSVAFLLVFCIFTGLLFLMMNRQLYLPLKRLMEKLNTDFIKGNTSEYEILDRWITDMSSNMGSLQNYCREQEEILMEHFLNRLIGDGQVDSYKLLQEYKNFDRYIILTCVMENAKGFRDLYEIDNFEKELQLYFPVKKIFVYSKETTYLVNIRNKEGYAQSLTALFGKVLDGGGFCLMGVSSPYSDIMLIKKAYEESRDALNYCRTDLFESAGSMRFYREEPSKACERMEICVKDTELIVNSLLNYNMDGVRMHLDHIVLKNREKPYIIQKELYNYLMNIFYAFINSRNINPEEVMSVSFNQYISDLKEVYSVQLLYKRVMESYTRLVEEMTKGKAELIDKILKYLENNYEKQLSLQVVANEFEISGTYLSQYFKKCTGTNFVTYIRDIRVEKAKEILKNENISVSEVAQKTGFDTVNTFIRVFKMLTGVTPGEYKNNIKQAI